MFNGLTTLALIAPMVLACGINSWQIQYTGQYPRVGMYSAISEAGFYPGGVPIDSMCSNQAKWDVVNLDVTRSNCGPGFDTVKRIREFNPSIKLIAYANAAKFLKCAAGWSWEDAWVGGCDSSAADYAWARVKAVRATNATLKSLTRDRNNDGKKDSYSEQECCVPITNNLWIDMAMPGAAQALADTFVSWSTETPGLFDGIFGDEICGTISWTETLGDSIDYTRSGQPSLAAWDAAYQAGVTAFFARIRATMPSTMTLSGNCGQYGPRQLNGWMRENFPFQNGGTWLTNMTGTGGADVGYLGDEALYAAPITTWLVAKRCSIEATCLPADLPTQFNDNAQRIHRWALGSATLGSGIGILTGFSASEFRGYLPWWADEFSVTPKGVSSRSIQYKGWLGDPLGTWFTSGAGYRRNFQGGCVLVNPSYSAPTTMTLSPSEGRYFRIRGYVCPTVNTGQEIHGSVQVPARDALFLHKRAQP